MFDYLGWEGAAADVNEAVESTINDGIVTYDLARLTSGVTEVKCSEFASAVASRLS